MIKTYSELIRIPTFDERYRYLQLFGDVGKETFGFKRWLNQEFYHSKEWLRFRDEIIFRDNGCDLGVEGFNIYGSVIIHHMNNRINLYFYWNGTNKLLNKIFKNKRIIHILNLRKVGMKNDCKQHD